MSIQEVRRAKLQALQERGIQPYAYRYDATHRSAAIRAGHAALETSGQPVRVRFAATRDYVADVRHLESLYRRAYGDQLGTG